MNISESQRNVYKAYELLHACEHNKGFTQEDWDNAHNAYYQAREDYMEASGGLLPEMKKADRGYFLRQVPLPFATAARINMSPAPGSIMGMMQDIKSLSQEAL